MPLLAEFGEMDLDTANAVMIGEYFARMDTAAALPGLRAIVEDWRPDVIVRECWEYASTLVAELHGIPVVRVALGLAAVEALLDRPVRGRGGRGARRARPAARPGRRPAARHAVPHDAPGGARGSRRRDAVADPSLPARRPRRGAAAARLVAGQRRPARLRDVRVGDRGRRTCPYFPALYRAAIDALAPLPVRVLLTIGDRRDPAELGPLPANVHVEEWVTQDAVAAARRGDRRPRWARDDARRARPRRAAGRRAAVQRRPVGERRRRRARRRGRRAQRGPQPARARPPRPRRHRRARARGAARPGRALPPPRGAADRGDHARAAAGATPRSTLLEALSPARRAPAGSRARP